MFAVLKLVIDRVGSISTSVMSKTYSHSEQYLWCSFIFSIELLKYFERILYALSMLQLY